MVTLIGLDLEKVYGFAIRALNSYLGLCAAWSLLSEALAETLSQTLNQTL